MIIKKYVKKPIPVEMVQITQETILLVANWCGGMVMHKVCDDKLVPGSDFIRINTREGRLKAYQGDYIAKGIEGEFYPIGKDIHEKTYLEVDVPEDEE